MKKMEKLKEVNKMIGIIINDLETRLFVRDGSVQYEVKKKRSKKRHKNYL